MSKLVLVLALGVLGCTDAQMSKWGALGNGATIECYSGGKLLGKWRSTGKVISEANSDGYFFKDADTRALMEVSGNCVIEYLGGK